MLAKTHALFSFLLGSIFLYYFEIPYQAIFLILIVLSSYLPDIDTPQSKLGKSLFFISYPLKFIFGHRKLFHSIFIPLILFGLLANFLDLFYLGLAIFLGYFTHLIGDAFSKEGIMFLYPISKFKLNGFFKVGGNFEMFLASLFLIIDFLIILFYFLS